VLKLLKLPTAFTSAHGAYIIHTCMQAHAEGSAEIDHDNTCHLCVQLISIKTRHKRCKGFLPSLRAGVPATCHSQCKVQAHTAAKQSQSVLHRCRNSTYTCQNMRPRSVLAVFFTAVLTRRRRQAGRSENVSVEPHRRTDKPKT